MTLVSVVQMECNDQQKGGNAVGGFEMATLVFFK